VGNRERYSEYIFGRPNSANPNSLFHFSLPPSACLAVWLYAFKNANCLRANSADTTHPVLLLNPCGTRDGVRNEKTVFRSGINQSVNVFGTKLARGKKIVTSDFSDGFRSVGIQLRKTGARKVIRNSLSLGCKAKREPQPVSLKMRARLRRHGWA
jgi:hypothetical protein